MRFATPLLIALLSGCAARSSAPATHAPSATPTPTDAPTPGAAPASVAEAPVPAPPPPSVEAEARELLDAMLRVDTSQGDETRLLQPVAARLRAAGVELELIESAPGRGNLIARLRGTGAKRPLLLLAHVDVVPTTGQPWTSDPFVPVETAGFLQARGVGDDKGMAAAATAIVLELARNKTPLTRDVVLALTAGEELGGDAGVRFLVAQQGALIDAELVLNEGGQLQLASDLKTPEAVLVSVGEKTFQSYRLIAKAEGGHSSAPPPPERDPVLALARALTAVASQRFPARLLPAVQSVLGLQAKYEKPPLSTAMARIAASGKITRADEAIVSQDKIYNALLRTTCVTTVLSASPQENVLPTSAEALINCRILPDETPETTRAMLAKWIADPKLELKLDRDKNSAPASPIEGDVMTAVRQVAAELWPGVPVMPSLMLGATDSRHLRAVGMLAYGVSVTPTSLAEARSGHGAHGPDERRPLAHLPMGVQFLRALTLALAR